MVELYVVVAFILVTASAAAQSPTDMFAIMCYIGASMFALPILGGWAYEAITKRRI